MSDGEFHADAYQGLLMLSALVLLGLSARGFGQRVFSRIVEALLGLAFLGYGAYLFVIRPEEVLTLWYAFVAPVVAVVHGMRSRRRAKKRRLFASLARAVFVEPTPPTPLTPFPPPPPPLGSQPAPAPAEPEKQNAPQTMPSGLPSAPPPAGPAEAEAPRPGMPSGLPRGTAGGADTHQPAPGRLHGVDDEPVRRRPPSTHAEDRPARRKLHGTEQFEEPVTPVEPEPEPEPEPAPHGPTGGWGRQPRHRADEPDDRPPSRH